MAKKRGNEPSIIMKVLIIGNGGREHALAWKVSQSSRVDRVFVAPGNAGTEIDAENVSISTTDIPSLLDFAKRNSIGLTIAGPEAPLAAGVVDAFQDAGLKIFGPTKAAAQLESSKVFCKDTLRQADVPTADFQAFRDADSAMRYIKARFPNDRDRAPVVVKADGLAAGKGVIVCSRAEDAIDAIDRIGRKHEFGDAGSQIVIEERLSGPEVSVLALTDGKTIFTLPPAQDHKPAYDNDKGPNTGGMGAYCPTPLIDEEMLETIQEQIIVPTIHTMKRNRKPFKGVLYAGLMMTQAGPKVLEFNVRFGDPECQPLLMRWKSDLVDVIEAIVDGTLEEIEFPEFDPRPSVCVVVASEGYPGDYEKGRKITGLDAVDSIEDIKVFHAGTKMVDNQVITSGGRVLGVTAIGNSVPDAKLKAYQAVQKVRWPGAWCRKDISDKAAEYIAMAAKEEF